MEKTGKKLEIIERRMSKRKKNLGNNSRERRRNEQKGPEIRKWIEEDKDKMGNIVDPYYKL